jgi:hypothetical protein
MGADLFQRSKYNDEWPGRLLTWVKVVFFGMALRQSGRACIEKLPARPSPRKLRHRNEKSRKSGSVALTACV